MANPRGKGIVLGQSPEVKAFTRISTPPCLSDPKDAEKKVMVLGCHCPCPNPCPCPCPCRCMCPCPRPR